MNVLEAEITSRLPKLADAGDASFGSSGMPALSKVHTDQWLIHGLSALVGESLGFRHAVVAKARSGGTHGEVGPRREDAFWPGLVDLLPAGPSSDIDAWKLAPIVWHESHIKPQVWGHGRQSQQQSKKWRKWKSIDQKDLLGFVRVALEQRLELTDSVNDGIARTLYRFLRPVPLPVSKQSGSDPGEALVLEVLSDRSVNALPMACEGEGGYFFVVGQFTRTQGLDSRLITQDGMQALYSAIAGGAHPPKVKCWDTRTDGLIAVAVGIEGALVIWSEDGFKVRPTVFGPAASLGLLWLIAVYQRETAELCAQISVRLSEQLKDTDAPTQLMNQAKSLVRWAVQEELCWMYSEAGQNTLIDEAFQRFQEALDIDRLWQDIREQCSALDNYLQTEHSGAQSRSLARLTMLVVPVPIVTALLTLNASDVQKWGEFIKVEKDAPWLERSVPNPAPPTVAAANTIVSAMNCSIEIDGSSPSNRRSAAGSESPPSSIKGTARCKLDAPTPDPSTRKSESAPITQSALRLNTNPLGLILGSVLALSLTMLAFAINHPLKRNMLTIGSLLVAAYFFVPSWALTSSIIAVSATAVTVVWYLAKGSGRGPYLGQLFLIFISVVCAAVLLRGLWLIGQPL